MELTTNMVSEITGVPPTTLNEWCRREWVVPTNNGKGTGSVRLWSLMDTVGAYYANQLRVVTGMGPEAVGMVLRTVANMSEDELVRNIEKHETIFFPGHNPKRKADRWMENPITLHLKGIEKLDRQQRLYLHALDIGNSYDMVKSKIENMRREAVTSNGRVRESE